MSLAAGPLAKARAEFLQTVREILADVPVNFTRSELSDAINAIDDWCTANASSFNSALPQPFRGAASAEQKAIILAVVALRRAGR